MTFTKEQELEIINLYNLKESSVKIAKLFNCKYYHVLKLLRNNNVHIRKPTEIKHKYSFNRNYFNKIDSPDKAYFLGLLYADGYVHEKTKKVTLSLQEEDGYILELMRIKLNHSKSLKYKIRDITRKPLYTLQLCSIELVKDLINLGCIQAKTFKIQFPTEEQVPKEFQSHFIRGYFDGDGCISYRVDKKSNRMHASINFVGTEDLLNSINELFSNNLNFYYSKLLTRHPERNHNIRTLNYSGNINALKLYNYLYKDCGDLYLTRKKEKFELIINQC